MVGPRSTGFPAPCSHLILARIEAYYKAEADKVLDTFPCLP